VVTTTAGTAQTSYGYTSEYYGDYNQLLYLRARHYAPGMGRFLTRDTWGGDYNRPLSLNRWNYSSANPINYTDPSGKERCWVGEYNYSGRADFAEKYVDRTGLGYPIRDHLNTYTAAGIGVQCYGTDIPDPRRPWDYNYSGFGAAQITNKEASTPYGNPIYQLNWLGKIVYENGKPKVRDYGLRCYIFKGYDCVCENFENLPEGYQLEPVHDQSEKTWAVEYMRRRIKLVTDLCVNCTSTDKYIAAALAQNGPGFNLQNMMDLTRPGTRIRKDEPTLWGNLRVEGFVTVDWGKYFLQPGNADDTQFQLTLFDGVIRELQKRDWYISDVEFPIVDYLKSIGDN